MLGRSEASMHVVISYVNQKIDSCDLFKIAVSFLCFNASSIIKFDTKAAVSQRSVTLNLFQGPQPASFSGS